MPFPNCRIACCLYLLLACFGTLSLHAETVELRPIADTSLIQVAPDANLGGAEFFNAGTAGNGNRNRGLMQFGLSESIPVGSLINTVTLILDVVRQPSVDLEPAIFGVHRLLTSWGEGDKVPAEEGSPGLGSPATEGEATWLFRFLGGNAWSAPGGAAGIDYATAASSTVFVYGVGDAVVFEATAELSNDVQYWVDHPESNFGWMLMTETEVIRKSARSFASSEDPNGGPLLIVDFTPVPEPTTLATLGLATFVLCCLARKRRQ